MNYGRSGVPSQTVPLEKRRHLFVACEFPALSLRKTFFNRRPLVIAQLIDTQALLLDEDDSLRKSFLRLLWPR